MTQSATELGTSFAGAVLDTHKRLTQQFAHQHGAPPEILLIELLYLDAFVFERVVTSHFSGDAAATIISAFNEQLALESGIPNFTSGYLERRAKYLPVWSAPPNYQTSTFIAGEISQRCSSTNYGLLFQLSTQVPNSYVTTLKLLADAKQSLKL